MPKLFAVRWQVGVALGVLVIAGTGVLLVGLRPAPGAAVVAPRAAADYTAEQDEFTFLTAALRRIDTELQQRGDGATASLRRERDAVVQRLHDVAIRVPRDRWPAEIAVLVTAGAPPAPGPAAADPIARLIERTVPAAEPRELRTGLGSKSAVTDVSLAADPPLPPLPVFVERRPRHRAAAVHAASDPTSAEPTKPAKDRPVAKEPAKQAATPDPTAKERPAPQRTAADPPEGRTAAR